MMRGTVLARVPVLALALAAGSQAADPIVSHLDTVSIHVDGAATYNALLELWSEGFQWPLMYGKPLAGEQTNARNYAGVWGGNVRLELCGPYPEEFQPGDAGARLHGLTFQPHDTAEKSALELDQHEIPHRPVATWGALKFLTFGEADMRSPVFSISIMEVADRDRRRSERERLSAVLEAKRGGPLGLRRVREVRLSYAEGATLRKWQRLLQTGSGSWEGSGGPALRLSAGAAAGIAAAVLEVESPEEAARFLKGLGFSAKPAPEGLECSVRGVRFVLTR